MGAAPRPTNHQCLTVGRPGVSTEGGDTLLEARMVYVACVAKPVTPM